MYKNFNLDLQERHLELELTRNNVNLKKEKPTLKLNSTKLGTWQGRNSFTVTYQTWFRTGISERV
jgi:hypothetical protein